MRLQPRDINDMIHMIRLSTYHLLKYQKIFAAEKDVVPEGNRIYYFSKELKVEPALVSSYFARNMDIYDFAFNMIEENLKILIEYKVDPVAILSNYATFKKDPEKIRSRFDRCLKARKVKLKPWLVHCSEKAFERSLKSSEDEKSLLGDGTILDYLSDRLGYDKETMYSIVSKHESILKGRVRRVKSMINTCLIRVNF